MVESIESVFASMKELEKQLKALANARRLAMLKLLRSRTSASVGEVARSIKLSFKATSKHLRILYLADLIEKQQINTTVHYRLGNRPTPGIQKIIATL